MNRCVWSHIYSCQNNIWYMREYFCWLSETIGAAIKSCFSEAPQHYEWENHTYGEEYLAVSCPYLLPTIYACCHLLQTHKELKWSDAVKSGHRHAKDVNCFHWFRQMKRIVGKVWDADNVLHLQYVWRIQVVKPSNFKKSIIKYLMIYF